MSQWGHTEQYHLWPLHIQRLVTGHGIMLLSSISLAMELSMHCEQSHYMTGTAVDHACMQQDNEGDSWCTGQKLCVCSSNVFNLL